MPVTSTYVKGGAVIKQSPVIILAGQELELLQATAKSPIASVRDAIRARIILLGAAGWQNKAIADRLGISRSSVTTWRNRFAQQRIAGLTNCPKKRTPLKYTQEDRCRVLDKVRTETAESRVNWSIRALSEATGVGRETVRNILRGAGLSAHARQERSTPAIC